MTSFSLCNVKLWDGIAFKLQEIIRTSQEKSTLNRDSQGTGLNVHSGYLLQNGKDTTFEILFAFSRQLSFLVFSSLDYQEPSIMYKCQNTEWDNLQSKCFIRFSFELQNKSRTNGISVLKHKFVISTVFLKVKTF